MEVRMIPRFRMSIAIAVFVLACLAAYPALACPVCYGASDAQSTQGITAAVFSLLGVTGAVLAGFVSLFVRIRNRVRALSREQGQSSAV
jgi:hypothetical protein